jgi:archaemetzincin
MSRDRDRTTGCTRRTLLRVVAGASIAAAADLGWRRPARAAVARTAIYIQPLGAELPEADVALVKEALVSLVGLDVRVLPPCDLPASAYYPARRRYRAEKLLAFLRGRLPPDGARVLGLVASDISTTKGRFVDWGVLGLGELPGTASVISSFRCHKKSRGPRHARERLAKVAVHEIGHTLGLDHCPSRGCLMEDAEGQVATCDREYDFCARCRRQVAAAGRPFPEAPRIPWPRPPA